VERQPPSFLPSGRVSSMTCVERGLRSVTTARRLAADVAGLLPSRAAKPISRSQSNGGFGTHTGPSRGAPCRRASRPKPSSTGRVESTPCRYSVARWGRPLGARIDPSSEMRTFWSSQTISQTGIRVSRNRPRRKRRPSYNYYLQDVSIGGPDH